jgi:hypothetical protein
VSDIYAVDFDERISSELTAYVRPVLGWKLECEE